MGPFRLLILAVLIYIGYRLIAGSFQNKDRKDDKPLSSQNEGKVTDILVEDPVCHKLVPKQQALRLSDNGEIRYFCSEECCNKFVSAKGEDE